jgi:hypothetical protein
MRFERAVCEFGTPLDAHANSTPTAMSRMMGLFESIRVGPD